MEDYRPNSHRSKEEQKTPPAEKKVEKVVKGSVKVQKNNVRKLTDVFISEDASKVKSYIFMDVLVPAIKKAVCDIVIDGVNMVLWGNTSGKGRPKPSGTYVSYNSYSSGGSDHRYDEPRSRDYFNYEDLKFETRSEAEMVRDGLDELIDRYGVANVADLYDMAGLTAPYTANKYGWTNVRTSEVIRVRDGYVLKMPKARPID